MHGHCIFVVGPFLGAIFGAIVYFIIIGGLLSLTDNSDVNLLNLVIILFSVAGYNWEWGIMIFREIGESFGPPAMTKIQPFKVGTAFYYLLRLSNNYNC